SVMCNIDADNLMPRGFAFHLNELMLRHARSVANFGRAPRNTKGRIAVFRRDFLAVGGYDESFSGWGWDDKDLRARLVAAGCALQWMDARFASFLAHSDERRVENMHADNRRRRKTSDQNAVKSRQNLLAGRIVANAAVTWGAAFLKRNFRDTLVT